MNPMASLERILISGGGTGGHIHPALAIADEIRRRYPDCAIHFVGAKGRVEMEKVPAAGYPILIAASAPTATAVDMAEEAGITLIALAGSALGLLIVGDLSERLGSFGAAFGVVLIAPLLVVLLVLTLYPETANRELEDIHPGDRR